MQAEEKLGWAKHLDFMAVDLAALLLSFALAYYIKAGDFTLDKDWRWFVVIIALLNFVIYLVANPYSGIFRRPYYHEIGRSFAAAAANAFCAALIIFVLKLGGEYSREVFINTYLFYFLASVVLKYIWKSILAKGRAALNKTRRIPIFLVSSSEHAERDIHSVYATDLPLYEIRGVYLIDGGKADGEAAQLSYREEDKCESIPVVADEPVRFVLDHNIREVLVAVQPQALDSGIYRELIANGVGVDLVVEPMLGFQTEAQSVTDIGVNRTLSVGLFSFTHRQSFYLIVKRLFDILCGLIGVVVLIPVTLLVKCAYLLSGDTAKIFYRQKRVGLNGKIIRIWKYRSMVPNAGELLDEMLRDERYRKEWEENQKFENDPRITKVGAVLRRTSVDELPQLINVLVGDMSLVGPRPLVEGELASHNGLKLYEKVKPGITGWWGCNGRSNINYRERLELEYYYVKNCSLYLDILCILRTGFAVLGKKGAQ